MVIPCGAAWRSTISADAIFDSFSSPLSQRWTLRVDVFIIMIIWRERRQFISLDGTLCTIVIFDQAAAASPATTTIFMRSMHNCNGYAVF